MLIIAWAITGPFFHYSDTWQLVINTSTTIVTFLMVFLIQNTQNRDSEAIQIKLDELIRANQNARNMMLCLEDLSEDELRKVKATFAFRGRACRGRTCPGNRRGCRNAKRMMEYIIRFLAGGIARAVQRSQLNFQLRSASAPARAAAYRS